jgi:hypothetical protein
MHHASIRVYIYSSALQFCLWFMQNLLLAECAARVVYTADYGCFDGLPIHAALFAVEASAVAELVHTF